MCYVVMDLCCPGHHHYSPQALKAEESWGVQGLCSAGGKMRFRALTQTLRSFFFNYTFMREMCSICTRHCFDVTFETHERIDSVDTNKRSVGQQKMCYKHTHECTGAHARPHVHAHTDSAHSCQQGMIDEARIQCTVWL